MGRREGFSRAEPGIWDEALARLRTVPGQLEGARAAILEAAKKITDLLSTNDDGRWWAAVEITSSRRERSTGKRTHKPKPDDKATDAEWREAYALAGLRAVAEARDRASQAVRELVEFIAYEHGTSALRLAEVASVSNATTARWLREKARREWWTSTLTNTDSQDGEPSFPWGELPPIESAEPADPAAILASLTVRSDKDDDEDGQSQPSHKAT